MIDKSNGRLFARKVVRLFGDVELKDIENEIRAITKLCKTGHENIVQVFEFGVLKEDSAWHFIDMELCDFTLEKYIQGADVPGLPKWGQFEEPISVFRARAICHINGQILNGLHFIHSHQEVHRDLSPQNGKH